MTEATTTDLYELSRPFPGNLVHTNPSGGGSYVKHHVVNQRLLTITGPFDFELVQIVRGFVAGTPPNPNGTSARAKAGTPDLHDAVVGAVCRLTVKIDGRVTRIEEVGDCEQPHNWPHDGARLKDALSDAFKRCAMRPGLGLHLWSQDEYFLDKQLAKNLGIKTEKAKAEAPPTSDETPPTSTESAPKDAATAEPPPKAPTAPPAPAEQATEGEQAELAEAIAIHEANLANPQRQVYRAWGRAQGLPFAQSGGIDTAKITLEQARAVEAHLTEMLTAAA